jgi:hypothetical protein
MSRDAVRLVLSIALVAVTLVDLADGDRDRLLWVIFGIAVVMVIISGRGWLKARKDT